MNQNIGRLQHRVHKQPERNLLHRRRFLLVLRQMTQPRHCRQTAKDPAELRMLSDRRLQEQRRLVRIDAARQQSGRHLQNVAAQFGRILRQRYRMHVRNEVRHIGARVLDVRPALDGAQIVAQMQDAGRLYAGNDAVRELFGWNLEGEMEIFLYLNNQRISKRFMRDAP